MRLLFIIVVVGSYLNSEVGGVDNQKFIEHEVVVLYSKVVHCQVVERNIA